MAKVVNALFTSILEFLNMDTKYNNNLSTLYLLHYSSTNQYGLYEHTDCGFITFLYTTGNLEIYKNDSWIDFSPIKNCFMVNVGDMLEELSNGIFKAIKHRVIPKNEKYSIAYFYEPMYKENQQPCEKKDKYIRI